MVSKRDVHNYELRYHGAVKRTDVLSRENKELILKMDRALGVAGVGYGRRCKVICCLTKIAKFYGGKDLSKAKPDDIDRIVLAIRDADYTYETRCDYLKVLKQFYKFLDKDLLVKNVVVKNASEAKLPDNKMSEAEAKKIIGATKDLRFKAFYSFLWETGCRPTEALSLKVKDLVIATQGKTEYALVSLFGKCGERKVPITECLPFLKMLAQVKDKDDYIFELGYRRYYEVLKELSGRKELTLYDFRRARATFLADGHMTESQLNATFGWVQGSPVVSRYVKISGKALIPTMLSLNTATVECALCGHANNPTLKFCDKCLKPLDAALVAEEKVKADYDTLMSAITNDKRFTALLKEHTAKLGK